MKTASKKQQRPEPAAPVGQPRITMRQARRHKPSGQRLRAWMRATIKALPAACSPKVNRILRRR